MNGEEIAALGFMIFGLGFFLFVMNIVMRSEERDYQRKVSEAREFGYDQSRLHNDTKPPRSFLRRK